MQESFEPGMRLALMANFESAVEACLELIDNGVDDWEGEHQEVPIEIRIELGNRKVSILNSGEIGNIPLHLCDSNFFTQPYGYIALDFRFVRTLTSDLPRCGKNDNCGYFNYNNAWGGTVNVSYTYSVPEPSTLVLLGIGMLGLGTTRIRKRAL